MTAPRPGYGLVIPAGSGGGGGGDVPDADALTKGIVQLAGDLAGTASAPTVATGAITSAKIADGTIVNADISASAAIAESKVSGLVADLAAKTDTTRSIATTAPLTGGGDLSANRTLAISGATTGAVGVVQLAGDLAGTATAPTVPGLAGKAATAHTHAESDVTNLVTDLAAKAPLASPALTGTPTAPTASAGTATTQVATTAFATTADATKVDKYTTQAKTANFTAAPGFFYLVDTTGGAVTATLPAANVAGQQLALKLNAGTTAVTVVPAGTDTIGAAATTASITLAAEVWEFVSSGSGQWNLVAGNKSLASLDGRYPLRVNDLSDLNSAATARTNLGLGTSATRAAGAGAGQVLSADTVDAKGDLLAATAADTIARLAVGTNGQFLTADSSASTGLAWGPGAVPRRPALAASWTPITNRPLVVPNTGTGTLAKDSWRFLPIRLTEDLPIDALAVTTTTAASGGTAALIFGLFALGADNRPGTRQTDYSSYGSIDLTQTAGILQLATTSLTIPAGEWYLGLGWSGTATGSPVMTTVTGHHPAISSVAATTLATAYLQAVSAATVPSSASVSTTASVAPLVHGKIR